MNSQSNKKNVLFSYNFLSRLIMAFPLSLMIFPINKAFSTPPYMISGAYETSMSYSSCKEKAFNTGRQLFIEQLEPYETNSSYQILGITAETKAVIYCIQTSTGSSVVVSSSSKYENTHGEAKSIFKRILDLMK